MSERRTRREPRLVRGPITGRVYVITDYDERPDGTMVTRVKSDVTDDFLALIADIRCPRCEIGVTEGNDSTHDPS